MPGLETKLHLQMLRRHRLRYSLLPRIVRAVWRELRGQPLYGMEWGDPDSYPPLKYIRDRYVLPYVNGTHAALEIGPGGGRWTRYLLGFRKLYIVDYYSEMLAELRRNFDRPNMVFIENTGTDFPVIEEHSIDYLFSYGTFVHLDVPLIKSYLDHMRMILKPGASAVIQYSDKTKPMARLNRGFSDNTPEQMRALVLDSGYQVLEEDVGTLPSSGIIRFGR